MRDYLIKLALSIFCFLNYCISYGEGSLNIDIVDRNQKYISNALVVLKTVDGGEEFYGKYDPVRNSYIVKYNNYSKYLKIIVSHPDYETNETKTYGNNNLKIYLVAKGEKYYLSANGSGYVPWENFNLKCLKVEFVFFDIKHRKQKVKKILKPYNLKITKRLSKHLYSSIFVVKSKSDIDLEEIGMKIFKNDSVFQVQPYFDITLKEKIRNFFREKNKRESPPIDRYKPLLKGTSRKKK
ncbi:MAG: hypothetical protein K2X86_14985 [Cytophagaceae bacterium]|nr:hypothetical protein [Cytophagaceae bacterium]